MKYPSPLAACAAAACAFSVLAFLVIGIATFTTRNNTSQQDAAFRTIDDVFAVHRAQGWLLVSAPTDGKRYRICGAMQSNPNSGVPSFSGSFKTGDRSANFDVDVEDGTIVAVEGLDPIDGSPLTYAVLVRSLPE
jgi:hypothetical protein